jgi:hypothetical protein
MPHSALSFPQASLLILSRVVAPRRCTQFRSTAILHQVTQKGNLVTEFTIAGFRSACFWGITLAMVEWLWFTPVHANHSQETAKESLYADPSAASTGSQ